MFGYGKVGCRILGLNQAWRLVYSLDYLCMGDQEQYEEFARAGPDPRRHALFAPAATDEWRFVPPEYAITSKPLLWDPEHPKRFSFDLTQGIYLNNTIASFGFQLAVWMLGERGTIYLLGIDSDGPQFDGKPMPPGTWENQRETLGYIAGVLSAARPGIQIYDLSPVSKQRVFERKKFEEVFAP